MEQLKNATVDETKLTPNGIREEWEGKRLDSRHKGISYARFWFEKKKNPIIPSFHLLTHNPTSTVHSQELTKRVSTRIYQDQ